MAASGFDSFDEIPLVRVDPRTGIGGLARCLPRWVPGDPYTWSKPTRTGCGSPARSVPRAPVVTSTPLALIRITPAGWVTTVPKVHPWSVASDADGHTWFLGATRRITKGNYTEPVDWVLGRVDTRTGQHLRTYRLDLPKDLGTVMANNGLHLNLFGATGGAIWLQI